MVSKYRSFHDILYTIVPETLKGASPSKTELDSILTGLGSQWAEAVSPADESLLVERLEIDNFSVIDIEKFKKLLVDNEKIDQIASSEILSQVIQILKCSGNLEKIQGVEHTSSAPFEHIWWPVIEEEIKRLHNEAVDKWCVDSYWIAGMLESFGNHLLDLLCEVSLKIIYPYYNSQTSLRDVLIKHVQKQAHKKEISSNGYQKFVDNMKQAGLRRLICEYPLFGKFIETTIFNWRQNSLNIASRTFRDRYRIAKEFGLSKDFTVVNVEQNLGDVHNKGQSVSILTIMSDDDAIKLVYKPKDLVIEKKYNDLIDCFNKNSSLESFMSIRVLPVHEYGYCEFVEHSLCKNEEEVAQFYWNTGRLLALLYILRCTDCHKENIIACGAHPVLLDVETLLESRIVDQVSEPSSGKDRDLNDIQQRISESVLQTGLLPYWDNVDKAKYPVDVSVLGCKAPDDLFEASTDWIEPNTDAMYLGSVRKKSLVPHCLPVGVGGGCPFFNHIDQLIDGFHKQSLEIIRIKDQLLCDAGPISEFRGIKKRIVLRPTATYFHLRELLLTPEACSNSINQGLALEVLSRSFIEYSLTDKRIWNIFKSEVKQLGCLDIPSFYHLTDGTVIFSDEEKIADFSNDGTILSGFDKCIERIKNFGVADMRFQSDLITGISRASSFHDISCGGSRQLSDLDLTTFLDEQHRINCANQQLELLKYLAIQTGQNKHVWIGMDLLDDGEKFRYQVLGDSLYSGISGVALLEKLVQEKKSDSWITDQFLLRIQRIVADRQELHAWWTQQSLGLGGCGGIIISLYLLGYLDCNLKIEVDRLVDDLLRGFNTSFLDDDFQFDIICGSAGLLGALLLVDTSTSITIAKHVSKFLVRHQHSDGCWKPIRQLATPLGLPDKVYGLYDSDPGLLGFSHGVVGIAAALCIYGSRYSDEDSIISANKALSYLKSHFQDATAIWPELRAKLSNSDTCYTTSWCHGTTGILLGLLILSSESMDCLMSDDEVERALRKWIGEAIPLTDHLCCGSLGISSVMRIFSNSHFCSKDINYILKQRINEIESQVIFDASSGEKFRTLHDINGGMIQTGFFTGNTGVAFAIHPDKKAREALRAVLSCGLLKPMAV